MKIFNFDNTTKELITESTARENPLEEGNFLIPANATIIEPFPAKLGFAICFDEQKNKWKYIEDNRNKIVYSKTDKTEYIVDYLGAIKDDFTLIKPELFDKWNGGAWEADIDIVRTFKIEEIEKNCEYEIVKGIKSSSLGAEYIYKSKNNDQLNLMGLLANGIANLLECGLVELVEDDIEKEIITWDYKTHTIEQLKQVFADMTKHKLDLLMKTNILKTKLETATTLEELDEINW